jgi:2-hydroxymuconate-semialdehyde hydrolase
VTSTVTVSGARIRVHATGDPARPLVVLLHGIGRSLEDWLPQHERLSDEYHVVSVDLAGFGLSEPLPGPVSLASLAAGVHSTLDASGLAGRRMHLMGNSLGGAVAMEYLTAWPDEVRTLTLVNSAGFGKEVTFALRLLAVPGLGRRMLARIDERASRQVERSLFFDRSHVTPERIAFGVESARRPYNAQVYLATAKALGGFRGIKPAWRRDLLTRVTAYPKPTLIVWGDKDLILPHAHLAAAAATFPAATTHLYPDTGHMPQIERADDFAALVRPFLLDHQLIA